MTNSILKKLQDASVTQTKKCKYAVVLSKLDQETQDFIAERTTLPPRHPHKLSYATLSRVLRSEKHNVGPSTIGDHYNNVCACASGAEEK